MTCAITAVAYLFLLFAASASAPHAVAEPGVLTGAALQTGSSIDPTRWSREPIQPPEFPVLKAIGQAAAQVIRPPTGSRVGSTVPTFVAFSDVIAHPTWVLRTRIPERSPVLRI